MSINFTNGKELSRKRPMNISYENHLQKVVIGKSEGMSAVNKINISGSRTEEQTK